MKIKQRAIIVSINDLNKSFEVKVANCPTALEADENGNVLLPLPKDGLGKHFEIGDEIEFKMKENNSCEMFNLSCQYLMLSKFKRDLNSILRRLDNADHPLKRCIILHDPNCVLISIKKNPDKVSAITELCDMHYDRKF